MTDKDDFYGKMNLCDCGNKMGYRSDMCDTCVATSIMTEVEIRRLILARK